MSLRRYIQIVENAQEGVSGDHLRQLAAAFERHWMKDISIVRNEWLIHFTYQDSAQGIGQDGFTQGSPLDSNLEFTSGNDYDEPGVNFAYDTATEYELLNVTSFTMGAAAEGAVVFRADGVRMLHPDGFHQVAFWASDIHRPIYAIHPEGHVADLEGEPHEWNWRVVSINGAPHEGPAMPLFDLLNAIEGHS